MNFPDIVYCPKCKRPVLPQFVDRDQKTAFCDGFQYSFSLEDSPERQRKETVIPNGVKNIRLTLSANQLTIKIHWFRNYSFRRVLQPDLDEDALPKGWSILIDPVGFVMAKALKKGMGWLLHMMAFLVNQTTIRVRSDYIWIEHKPIDILPVAFFHVNQIEQFFVRKAAAPDSGQERISLFLKLKNGQEYDIVWDLRLDVLLYLEQEIERILGIEDREMPDEIL